SFLASSNSNTGKTNALSPSRCLARPASFGLLRRRPELNNQSGERDDKQKWKCASISEVELDECESHRRQQARDAIENNQARKQDAGSLRADHASEIDRKNRGCAAQGASQDGGQGPRSSRLPVNRCDSNGTHLCQENDRDGQLATHALRYLCAA